MSDYGKYQAPSTMIVFPCFIGGITGISYLRVGIRKVWMTLTNGQTVSVPRKRFPNILPEGDEVAFLAARILTDGPQS